MPLCRLPLLPQLIPQLISLFSLHRQLFNPSLLVEVPSPASGICPRIKKGTDSFERFRVKNKEASTRRRDEYKMSPSEWEVGPSTSVGRRRSTSGRRNLSANGSCGICNLNLVLERTMGNASKWSASQCLSTLSNFFRKYLFRVVSCGAIPTHIAFIMDGNRRFAKKQNMVEGKGHRAGYKSLISMLNDCYELGVKYITVYAFSIENFKRKPEEVQYLMDLTLEKINELLREESIVNQYGIRLYFIGNLKLLREDVRAAVEKAMKATAHNSQAMLLICVAYTSSDEIVHAVQESCEEKMKNIQAENTIEAGCDSTKQNGSCEKMNGVNPPEIQDCHKREVHGTVILGENEICCNGFSKLEASERKNGVIKHAVPGFHGEKWNEVQESMQSQFSKGTFESSEDGETVREIEPLLSVVDIEKHMYMAVAPDPDIVIRSSGETRLSNFLMWQTGYSLLYSPAALWPEIGLWQLVGVVLHYQRIYSYLQKKRKQS